jgi:hypothetical protein
VYGRQLALAVGTSFWGYGVARRFVVVLPPVPSLSLSTSLTLLSNDVLYESATRIRGPSLPCCHF